MKQYEVTGMTCAACSAHVEKAVSKVQGVDSVSVSLLTNSMGIEGDASPEEVVKAVEKAGYGASLKGAEGVLTERTAGGNTAAGADSLRDRETPVLKKRLIVSLCFLLPLMYVSMGHMMWGWPLPGVLDGNHVGMGLFELLFAVVVMVINQKFFISGFTSLIHGSPNMDTLVALGAGASFGYSTYALFAMTAAQVTGDMNQVMFYMDEFYFESAAMILTLITVGKTLEAYSKGKTTNALKSLMNLAPKMATVVRDGVTQKVSVDQVHVGDVFVVRAGESIPVDGEIIEGSAAVDESALTGESIPVDKNPGDRISAATINQSGFLTCRADRVGEDTTLSQIIKMVSDAAATKAPIAKIADKVSGVFVPAVIAIAAVTMVIWLLVGEDIGFALARGISVLVISCPCALGLATPVAIMVGNGVGAKHGILFKTAVSLENTGKIDIVALDKTGTITAGTPRVTDVLTADGVSQEELLQIAFLLEEKSEHPLARAVTGYVEEISDARERADINKRSISEIKILAGNGLTGWLTEASGEKKKQAFAGSRQFIGTKSEISTTMEQEAERISKQGKTPMFFATEEKFLGLIAVADVIKPDSRKAVKELQNMGMKVVMLTGDNRQTAETIGHQAGVDEVIAGVLPDGKEEAIRNLQKQGRVAMVGDGINDAPALTRADIGIGIGAGTDVAIEAADIVLMKSSLMDVPAAVRLSKAVIKNIHENLFWAFFYNVVGIPLAAGAWIHLTGWQMNPMFGAAAMSLSSFCVVTNALRLNLVNIRETRHGIIEKNNLENVEKENNAEREEEKMMEKTMKINGMMCGHCEARVKKALEAVVGVKEAAVSHETGVAVVTLEKEVADDILKKAVEDQDYEVVSVN